MSLCLVKHRVIKVFSSTYSQTLSIRGSGVKAPLVLIIATRRGLASPLQAGLVNSGWRSRYWWGGWIGLAIVLTSRREKKPLLEKESELRFVGNPARSLVTALTFILNIYVVWSSLLHAALREVKTELSLVGGPPVGSLHCRADVFETGAGLRFCTTPPRTRPTPIYLRGPAIQFHKQGWRVRQDKGKVRRATYSHPH
jgi:hypothetical protein